MRHVLILGGGFGGIYAALRLQSGLRKRRDVAVTLVNRENFFLLTSMLPQVAASSIDTRHIVAPIRRICPHIQFYQADVRAMDLQHKTVDIAHGDGVRQRLDYDYLLVALGSVTNFFGIPGVEEHALPIKTLPDGVQLRNHALDMLEQAELARDPQLRSELLSFVVVGAGFAGVETAAELDLFMRNAAVMYKNFGPSDIRTTIVDMQTRLLPEMSERLGTVTQATLRKRGVEFRLGARVASADARTVTLVDGERLPARTLVWAGGVARHPLIAALPQANARGRLPTNATLEVQGCEHVWAAGDCAEILDPGGTPYPPTAQHALREGVCAGDNIVAAIDGIAQHPFAYRMRGQMADLGQHQAVAMIGGIKLSGFPAWWLWRTYYLMRLPTLEKKVRVAIDWTLDLFFPRDTVRLSEWSEARPSGTSANQTS